MSAPAVGFVGFGEAGFAIGGGLKSAGVERLFAFDIAADSADRGSQIRSRAEQAGAALVGDRAELARSCDVIFSAVTSSSALDAARENAPCLEPRHLFVDINSVSPALKREIADVVSAAGAAFVEAAVRRRCSRTRSAFPC